MVHTTVYPVFGTGGIRTFLSDTDLDLEDRIFGCKKYHADKVGSFSYARRGETLIYIYTIVYSEEYVAKSI
jgi:hypothetical protein